MRELLEGSQAIARTVARCRPGVVPAYPITPQTHIVEALGTLVRSGALHPCRFLTVESEFAAMSAAIGASATGARTYTATASQGLLYMAEALYNAGGLGMPIVMTVANRAIGAPINIWNDHSDAMSQRDCGWVQLYAPDNQQAVGLHVLAFRLAEQLSVPVMVCVDGFVLTHAFEPIELPDQDVVDAFLPPLQPRQSLDPAAPVTIGALVGPDAYTEVRYLAHRQLLAAEGAFADLCAEWFTASGQALTPFSVHAVDGAPEVVVTLGSTSGTVLDAVDGLDEPVGVLTLTMFRPFPTAALRAALAGAERVIVIERAFAPGVGGIVAADVEHALAGTGIRVDTVVAGLGGRAVTVESVRTAIRSTRGRTPGEPVFLDLRVDVVEHALEREPVSAASNPGASR
jgi:pyruvate ferredoxin oxidoreductase alpha subunit